MTLLLLEQMKRVQSTENKWVREIAVLNEHDFVNQNRALKDLKEVTLKGFQFKINNITKTCFISHRKSC